MYDVSDNIHPKLAYTIDLVGISATTVTTIGNTVIVLDSFFGFAAFDFTDPYHINSTDTVSTDAIVVGTIPFTVEDMRFFVNPSAVYIDNSNSGDTGLLMTMVDALAGSAALTAVPAVKSGITYTDWTFCGSITFTLLLFLSWSSLGVVRLLFENTCTLTLSLSSIEHIPSSIA